MLHLVWSGANKPSRASAGRGFTVLLHSPRLIQQMEGPQGAFVITAHFQNGGDCCKFLLQMCKISKREANICSIYSMSCAVIFKDQFPHPETVGVYIV